MTTLVDVVATVAGDVDRGTALRTLVAAAVTTTTAGSAVLELVDEQDRVVERWEAGPPAPDPGPEAVLLTCPVRRHTRHWGSLHLARDGGTWSEEDRQVAASLADAVALVLDVARSQHLVERRRVWLEATSALLEHAASPFDLDRALSDITTRTAVVTGAAGVAIVQVLSGGVRGSRPVVVASRGLKDPGVAAAVDAAAGHLAAHGVPVEDLEVPGDLVTVVVPLRSLVAAPGVLVLVHRDARSARDVEERALLGGFADQAGLALDRAQAVADQGRLESVAARDRESREMHDVVLQRLFATGMQLQAVRMTSDDETGARIDEVVDALDVTIRDIRGSIFPVAG